ncbi:hypothetical protein IWX50DRAFT_24057 [Phyllosticta citricarpa]
MDACADKWMPKKLCVSSRRLGRAAFVFASIAATVRYFCACQRTLRFAGTRPSGVFADGCAIYTGHSQSWVQRRMPASTSCPGDGMEVVRRHATRASVQRHERTSWEKHGVRGWRICPLLLLLGASGAWMIFALLQRSQGVPRFICCWRSCPRLIGWIAAEEGVYTGGEKSHV